MVKLSKYFLLLVLAIFHLNIFSNSLGRDYRSIDQLIFDSQKLVTRDHKNLLTLVLMVKDEEPAIIKTLESYIDSGINYVLLYDTGSTDKTVEVARDYLKEQGVNFFIREEPFIDFATSRNRALRLAEDLFPDNKFMIMPDAEWYLHGGTDILKFCEENLNDSENCYLIKIINPGIDFGMPRLIRAHEKIKFIGKCHEVPSVGANKQAPANIYFELGISRFGLDKSTKRWSRDRDVLLKEFMENPQDSRTSFYLAQTYHCLNDFKNAYKFYKFRSKLVGWPEEDFMTLYRLAQVAENLKTEDGGDNWPEALYYYLEAYSFRPNRVEPLIKIARHYLHNRNPLCYLFAKKACDTPYPANDILFIDKYLYDYERYDLLAQCSWYIGEYEDGEKAVRKTLEVYPDNPQLKRNLEFYLDRKSNLEGQISG